MFGGLLCSDGLFRYCSGWLGMVRFRLVVDWGLVVFVVDWVNVILGMDRYSSRVSRWIMGSFGVDRWDG